MDWADIEDWTRAKQTWNVGDTIEVEVTHQRPFGVFVALPGSPVMGLIRITDLLEKPGDPMPEVGTRLRARIIDFTDHNRQVILTLRPSIT